MRFSPQVDRPKRSPAPVYVQFARAILRISKPATRDQTKPVPTRQKRRSAKCAVRIAQTSSCARAPVGMSRSSARNADGRSDGSICQVSYQHRDFWGRRLRRRDARVHRAMGSAHESSREDATHRSSDSLADWQFSKERGASRPAAPIFIAKAPARK